MLLTKTREVKGFHPGARRFVSTEKYGGTVTGRWKRELWAESPEVRARYSIEERDGIVGLKYVGCKFPGTAREYTYHTELELQVGDKVKVQTSAGVATITVTSLGHSKPKFPTKGIIEVVK